MMYVENTKLPIGRLYKPAFLMQLKYSNKKGA